MPKGKLSEQDKTEIRDLIQKGQTKGQIASKFKVSEQTIYTIKREMKSSGVNVPEPTGYGHIKGKKIPTNGNVVYLRGKAFSLDEILETLSPEKYLYKLTDNQLSVIASSILRKAMRAHQLEEMERTVPNLQSTIKSLEEEVKALKQQGLKAKLLETGGQVVHGD